MAAPILALEGVGLDQGSRWLFRGLDLFVGPRDRLALVGRNGVGKTTLLRLLAGDLQADAGRRVVQPGARVVLLEQDPPMGGFATLGDYARAASGVEEYEIASLADQLGVDLDRPAATASGGERRRVALTRALAQSPDVLLLDEPTNHLDIAAIEWLEGHLARYPAAIVAISHDRAFLARLTSASLWLDRGRLRRAEIGFGGFEAWAEQVAAEDARTAQRLDTKLAQEEHWLTRGVTARRSRNMGRLARLHELRAERRDLQGQQGTAKLAISADDARTKVVIDAEHVVKRFGERTVIADLTLRVRRGDRIGIIGPNGAGKTTLLKLLTGQLAPDAGRLRRAETLTLTVIDQTRSRLLTPGATVRDVLAEGGDWLEVGGVRKHLAGHLKDFLFDPGVADAPVDSFSGGEKARLLLAREFARPAGLLVLDEPTNDLDLETLDLLQEVVADYPGTVLIVSHDRDFLDRTVTAIVALDGSGQADISVGGYSDWAARRSPPQTARTSSKPGASTPGVPTTSPALPIFLPRPAKLSFKDQRELDRLPELLYTIAQRIAAIETSLADPSLYARDPAGFAKLTAELDEQRAALTAAEDRWLELEDKNSEVSAA